MFVCLFVRWLLGWVSGSAHVSLAHPQVILPWSGIPRSSTKIIQPRSTTTNWPTTGKAKTIDETNTDDSTRRNSLLPRNLTWNLKMMVFKRNLLFQGLLFRFHVKFLGCNLFCFKTLCKILILSLNDLRYKLKQTCKNQHTPTHILKTPK